jgi:hypothetical protein
MGDARKIASDRLRGSQSQLRRANRMRICAISLLSARSRFGPPFAWQGPAISIARLGERDSWSPGYPAPGLFFCVSGPSRDFAK